MKQNCGCVPLPGAHQFYAEVESSECKGCEHRDCAICTPKKDIVIVRRNGNKYIIPADEFFRVIPRCFPCDEEARVYAGQVPGVLFAHNGIAGNQPECVEVSQLFPGEWEKYRKGGYQ